MDSNKPKAYIENGKQMVFDGVDIHHIERADIDNKFETQYAVFEKVDNEWILTKNKTTHGKNN